MKHNKTHREQLQAEGRSRRYFLETGDQFNTSELNRPYFIPLPEDWMRHKHLNVPQDGETYSELEKGLMSFVEEIDFLEEIPKKTEVVPDLEEEL